MVQGCNILRTCTDFSRMSSICWVCANSSALWPSACQCASTCETCYLLIAHMGPAADVGKHPRTQKDYGSFLKE